MQSSFKNFIRILCKAFEPFTAVVDSDTREIQIQTAILYHLM